MPSLKHGDLGLTPAEFCAALDEQREISGRYVQARLRAKSKAELAALALQQRAEFRALLLRYWRPLDDRPHPWLRFLPKHAGAEDVGRALAPAANDA